MPGTRLLVITGLLVACLLLASCRSEAPPPLPARVAYEELARKAQGVDADVPNGWQHLVDAISALEALEGPIVGKYPNAIAPFYMMVLSDEPSGDDGDESYPEVDADSTQAALDVLARIPDSEVDRHLQNLAEASFVFGEPQPTELNLKVNGRLRNLSRMLFARARGAADKQDWPQFERAVLQSLAVGWALQCNIETIDMIGGWGIEWSAFELLHRRIERIPDDALGTLAAWFETHPFPSGQDPTFLHQRQLDNVAQTYAGMDAHRVARMQSDVNVALTRVQDLLQPIAHLDRPARLAHANWQQATDELNALRDQSEEKRLIALVAQSACDNLKYFDVPSLRRLAIRTHLAIERYRRVNGRYPASLEALVPEFLPAVETERLSGKPLVYSASADGSSFTLYAVGIDAQDNGGNFHPSSYHNALKEDAGQGYDFPIWPLPQQP